MEVLGLTRDEAGGLTLPSGVAYLLAAYPAALLAERFGRLRVIGARMVLFVIAMVAGAVVQIPTGTIVAFCLGAAGAAAFSINAAAALWNLAPSSRVLGTYTGLYAVTWYLGGFGGPALITTDYLAPGGPHRPDRGRPGRLQRAAARRPQGTPRPGPGAAAAPGGDLDPARPRHPRRPAPCAARAVPAAGQPLMMWS